MKFHVELSIEGPTIAVGSGGVNEPKTRWHSGLHLCNCNIDNNLQMFHDASFSAPNALWNTLRGVPSDHRTGVLAHRGVTLASSGLSRHLVSSMIALRRSVGHLNRTLQQGFGKPGPSCEFRVDRVPCRVFHLRVQAAATELPSSGRHHLGRHGIRCAMLDASDTPPRAAWKHQIAQVIRVAIGYRRYGPLAVRASGAGWGNCASPMPSIRRQRCSVTCPALAIHAPTRLSPLPPR